MAAFAKSPSYVRELVVGRQFLSDRSSSMIRAAMDMAVQEQGFGCAQPDPSTPEHAAHRERVAISGILDSDVGLQFKASILDAHLLHAARARIQTRSDLLNTSDRDLSYTIQATAYQTAESLALYKRACADLGIAPVSPRDMRTVPPDAASPEYQHSIIVMALIDANDQRQMTWTREGQTVAFYRRCNAVINAHAVLSLDCGRRFSAALASFDA